LDKEYPLSQHRREEVWESLSEVFVDNEVDYERIAKNVADIGLDNLKKIFFEEVAPYCGPNLMSPIPPIWSDFDKEKLPFGIRAMKSKNRRSVITNMRYEDFVVFSRFYFRKEWLAIETKLVEQ